VIVGTVYGVALNDAAERATLAPRFIETPYLAPPQAPVLYIKSRNCLVTSPAEVRLDDDVTEVEVGATIGVIFGRDASRESPDSALSAIAAACLVADLSDPHDSYYRPAVRARCRDGFLPFGAAAAFTSELLDSVVTTRIDGESVHRWALERTVRDVATLIVDITAFMTLEAGAVLLVGLPGDGVRIKAGHRVTIHADRLPQVQFDLLRSGTSL
jgi:5-oxopent-3-ene-1,2,5-tricarboxylate decarboxylase/2-hydroxyhepta-2,4-diene-1,7-dioate isomerase